MSFVDALRSVFTQFATFTGRARRSEYWYFALFSFVLNAVVGAASGDSRTTVSGIVTLILLLPSLAVLVRRLHDTGRSGWNALWLLLFVIGWIVLLVQTVQDSQPGGNVYGPSPKEAPGAEAWPVPTAPGPVA